LRLMNAKGFLYLANWVVAGAVFSWLISFYGCASIGSPLGGSKDSLPPVLVKALPENFTPNFKAKTITLNFDEYVEVANVFEKLIINPPLEKFPLVDRKLRTVTIRIKDTLEPNTTYSWRFDDVIKDVNEGNPFGNYTYVFSTGPTFDSASFSGRVIGAQTGRPDSTLIVVLHRNLSDTAIEKLKPRYITKLDSSGVFRFDYLAPGRYNVFALKDEGMKRYTDSTIPFAFHSEVIEVSDSTSPVEMLFFQAKQLPETQPSPSPDEKEGKNKEEEKPKNLLVRQSQDIQGNHDIMEDYKVQFNSPVQTFDSTLLVFTDTLYKPLPYNIKLDSTGTNLIISHAWKLETYYSLIFKKGFATDSTGRSFSKEDTILFRTKGEADYGLLKIQFSGLQPELNPVLQFYESDKLIRSQPLSGNTFLEKLFKPGSYNIRILLDKNKNGVWDTGDYYTKLQPERTLSIEQKISVKGNWENEYDIALIPDNP
jgi:hypothetical protein